MRTSDDVTRWSQELASNPDSLVFLPLGEALRRQGQLDVARRIAARGVERHPQNADAHDLMARVCADLGDDQRASDEWATTLRLRPSHVGALKGLGFVCFRQGRLQEAEEYLKLAAEHGPDDGAVAALAHVRRAVASHAAVPAPVPADPRQELQDIASEAAAMALVLDSEGLVLAGQVIDAEGRDVAPEIGAHLSGVSDEAGRATRHLAIGRWRYMLVETTIASIAITPAADGRAGPGNPGSDAVIPALIVLLAPRETPLGLLRRVLERCAVHARSWLGTNL